MIKNSINKILWHVVRYECLVGIEILKYEFWPFLQQTGKKTCNGHNFCIRRRNNANNMSKKSWEKSEFESTRVYPVSNSQIPQIQKEKKVIWNRRFFAAKSKKFKKFKKIQKFKNSKKDTEMYNKEDCWLFLTFCFYFFGFF